MLPNRLFNVLIAIAVILVTGLTVREALATSAITSQTAAVVACDSLPSHYSIHARSMNQIATSILYTEDGPVGVDGGLRELMSAYRNCSR
jgi:hypothetical protein